MKLDPKAEDQQPRPAPPTAAQKKAAQAAARKKAGSGKKGTIPGKATPHKKTSGTTKPGKKSTHRRDLTREDTDLVIGATDNGTITDVMPLRFHSRDWDLSKRRLPDRGDVEVPEGGVGYAGPRVDIFTDSLISCTAILAIDRVGRKVLGHFCPARSGDRPGSSRHPHWHVQFSNFLREIEYRRLDYTGLRFHVSVPGYKRSSPNARPVAQGLVNAIAEHFLRSRRDRCELYVTNRVDDPEPEYIYDLHGRVSDSQRWVLAKVYTVRGVPHFAGAWYQTVWPETGPGDIRRAFNSHSITHERVAWTRRA